MNGVCIIREPKFGERNATGGTGRLARVFDFDKNMMERIDGFARRLESKHWFTRMSGVCGLFLTGRDAAFPYLVKALKDENGRVKTEAFYSVLGFIEKHGSNALLYSLNEEDSFVRVVAATLLGKMRESKAAEPLRRRIAVEPDETVKDILIWAFAQCSKTLESRQMDSAA